MVCFNFLSALSAYVNTILFNVLALLVCLISIWVELNSLANREFRRDAESRSIFVRSDPGYRECFTTKLRVLSEKFGHSRSVEEPICRVSGAIENLEINKISESNGETFDPSSISVLGLEKYEVFALLASSCMSLVVGSLVSVEVVARLSDQPYVHT